MAYSYDYLPDVAIADAAFAARADTLTELFIAAALATAEVMVDIRSLRPIIRQRISVQGDSREDLLYRWLSELLYLKDVEYLIFVDYDIVISETATSSVEADGGKLALECTAGGERIDPRRHTLGQDVKAVTYHLFEIKEVEGEYLARVVLDI